MPEFYSDVERRNHFSAPQMTITRQRYRGPRESEKINLEMNQLAFSIKRLYERYDQLAADFVEDASILLEGGTLFVESENGPLKVDGLENLTGRIEDLSKRLKALEE